MGLQVKKTRAPYASAAINAAIARGAFDPRTIGVKLTPPQRTQGAPPREKTSAELAVEAQNAGMGGTYKQPVGELLAAIRKAK